MFVALQQGADAAAGFLLGNSRVTIPTAISVAINAVDQSLPVLFIAVHFVREQVVLALLRRGVDIKAPRTKPNGERGSHARWRCN